MMQNLH